LYIIFIVQLLFELSVIKSKSGGAEAEQHFVVAAPAPAQSNDVVPCGYKDPKNEQKLMSLNFIVAVCLPLL
jgi:hypothetical protein